MRQIFWPAETYNEFNGAMKRVTLGLRRGDLGQVQDWLTVAERCLRLQSRLDEIRIAEDKRQAWRRQQPLQLRALEQRANFGR